MRWPPVAVIAVLGPVLLMSCADDPKPLHFEVLDSACDTVECQTAVDELQEAGVPTSPLGYGGRLEDGSRIWFLFDPDIFFWRMSGEHLSSGDGSVAYVIQTELVGDDTYRDVVRCRTASDEILVSTCDLVNIAVPVVMDEARLSEWLVTESPDGDLFSISPLRGASVWLADD